MTRLRGAIIGCGTISEFHLRAWERIPEVAIVALCDPVSDRAEGRRQAFAPEAKVYADARVALDRERLDFVEVLTPPSRHKEICLWALERSLHVICQKPLCEDLEEARELVNRAATWDRYFVVHENHRYRPWFQDMIRRARQGDFGALRYVHFEQFDPEEPREGFKLEGEKGILIDFGVHLVDMMRALLGEPERVHGRFHRANSRVRGESIARLTYDYPQTTVGIDMGWKQRGIPHGSVLVLGDGGEALYQGTTSRFGRGRYRVMRDGQDMVDETRAVMDYYLETFVRFERMVTDAMLGGGAVEQTAAENLKTLEATFAAYRSGEEGCIIELTPS